MTPDPEISKAAAAFGRLGGRAGKGKAKRRTTDFYKKIGAKGGKKAARRKKKAKQPKPTET